MITSEHYRGFVTTSKALENGKFLITVIAVSTKELIKNSVDYNTKSVLSIDENDKWFSISIRNFIFKSDTRMRFIFENETPFTLKSIIDFEESTRFNILDNIYCLKGNYDENEPTLINITL